MIIEYSQRGKESDVSGLTFGKRYVVICIEGDWYRVLNDRNDPVLYDPNLFVITESSEPIFWITEYLDGQRYSYPKVWSEPGFFEDFHDGVPEVVKLFWDSHKKYFAR